jgi:hypothetical protein
VYDNRAVVLAWSRTKAVRESFDDLKRRGKAAIDKGDTALVERLEREGDRRQWTLHRQAFGRASVREYLIDRPTELAAIAREAKVSLIVWETDYIDPAVVEQVDVTDALVRLFKPDEPTLRMIEEMKKVQPLPIGFDFND